MKDLADSVRELSRPVQDVGVDGPREQRPLRIEEDGVDPPFGVTAQVPFFWNISPSQDLTLSPIFTSNESAVFVGTDRAGLGVELNPEALSRYETSPGSADN